jgi:ABC-type glutathione transport system ATPase component
MHVQRLTIDTRHATSVPGKRLVDIAFEVDQSLALVGQSGSGKSLTLKALLGLLPASLKVRLEVQSDYSLRAGKTVSFVPQNAFTALSPMTRIRHQWLLPLDQSEALLDLVGLDRGLLNRFPGQLSGGQLQRVVLVLALASRPRLVLLDEPTTAIDPHLRDEIVSILLGLQQELGFQMLFVTHDIRIAQRVCQDILVLNEGRVVEQGSAHQILSAPAEAYTRKLIASNFSGREFRT